MKASLVIILYEYSEWAKAKFGQTDYFCSQVMAAFVFLIHDRIWEKPTDGIFNYVPPNFSLVCGSLEKKENG